jgi:hypothetical protein
MSTTEDRLRDAATALAGAVRPADIPPLRLPEPGAASRVTRRPPRRRGARRVLVPLAAASAAAAVIAAVTVAARLGTPPPRPAPQAHRVVASQRPRPGAWTISARLPRVFEFSAVTAAGRDSAWAFTSSEDDTARPTAWRLAGRGWQQVAFPGRLGEQVDVARASSPDDVWAFTSFSRVLHWDGRSWAVVRGTPQSVMADAIVFSSTDVWAFGQANDNGDYLGTWHFDGRTWARVPSATGLYGASALSSADIWAAGGADIARWTGTTWTRSSVAALLPPDPAGAICGAAQVDDVYAQSDTDVWATASATCQDVGGPSVLLRYAAGRWHRVARLGDRQPLTLVPDGRGGVWLAMAQNGDGSPPAGVLHYSGGQLRRATLPIPAGQLFLRDTAGTTGTVFTVGGLRNAAGTADTAVILRFGG